MKIPFEVKFEGIEEIKIKKLNKTKYVLNYNSIITDDKING